jgi:Zonular occludens toxin (Zot)
MADLESGLILVTGGNGIGKTSLIVSELLKIKKKSPERRIYVHAIRGLTLLEHDYIYCGNPNCYYCYIYPKEKNIDIPAKEQQLLVQNWDTFDQNSIVVIDECTYVFPSRGSTSATPPTVQKLVNRRARGIDMYVICPEPTIDHEVKGLASVHIHFMPFYYGFIRRIEFSVFTANPNNNSQKGRVTFTRLRKETFGSYVSATVHTGKVKRKLPIAYILLAAVVVFTVYSVIDLVVALMDDKKQVITDQVKPLPTQQKPVQPLQSAPMPSTPTAFVQQPIKPTEPVKSARFRVAGSISIGALTYVYVERVQGGRSFKIDATLCRKRFGEYECDYDGEYITVDSGQMPNKPSVPVNVAQNQIAQ